MTLEDLKSQQNKLYKNRYYIVFYDASDEFFVAMFNNIYQICKYKGKDYSEKNLISVELCRAIKRKKSTTRMLDGSLMHVHLIDVKDIDGKRRKK